MDEQILKETVAKNLVYYRKTNHFTQLELAEKLNYSDKSVSKWERAESIPDVFILQQLAELYNVTVNDFVSQSQRKRPWNPKEHHLLISLLSAGLVWFVAVVLFVFLQIFLSSFTRAWLFFIYAVPASAIVLLVLTAVWSNKILCCTFISLLIWGLSLSIFLTAFAVPSVWLIFIIALPLQILTILWFFLKRNKKKV